MITPEHSTKHATLQAILEILETLPAETVIQFAHDCEREALESGWMPAEWYRLSLTEKRYTKTWKSERE